EQFRADPADPRDPPDAAEAAEAAEPPGYEDAPALRAQEEIAADGRRSGAAPARAGDSTPTAEPAGVEHPPQAAAEPPGLEEPPRCGRARYGAVEPAAVPTPAAAVAAAPFAAPGVDDAYE